MIKIKKGLNLPISGAPEQRIAQDYQPSKVAILGADFHGLKPTLQVAEGDQVQKGQVLFTDKKNEQVQYTAPASGEVVAINRGAKRVFESLVIAVNDAPAVQFAQHALADLSGLARSLVVEQLVASGEWTALRTRPFNKVPAPNTVPQAIFVTAMDSRPHAPNANLVIAADSAAFDAGLEVVARLTEGATFVCLDGEAPAPSVVGTGIRIERFEGLHPAGLVGTHIHYLEPVHALKTVWHLHYQDVIAIGHLFLTGEIYTQRVISLAGPAVAKPQLVKTVRGAALQALTEAALKPGNHRVISGSVLDGRTAEGPEAFVGRFHLQVAVLSEGTDREFLGFVAPGSDKFSITRLFTAWLLGKKEFDLTTSTGGSERSMIPLGSFERLAALDILPTQLLRALLVDDVESSIELGCLELDEEDLALFTFACPGKYEYGPYLRQMLTKLEADG